MKRRDISRLLANKRVPESLDDLEKRLWSKVRRRGEDQCWPWLASKLNEARPYGRIGVAGGLWLAHRLIYVLEFDELPDGMCVLHRCDNPRCCNPSHYFLGTQKDNNRDAAAKGRNGKLTISDVEEIRSRKIVRGDRAAIAAEFGISISMLKQIRHWRAWQ